MNLVALIVAPSVVIYADNVALRAGVTAVAVGVLVGAVLWSKSRGSGTETDLAETGGASAPKGAPESGGGATPQGEVSQKGDTGAKEGTATDADDRREEARAGDGK